MKILAFTMVYNESDNIERWQKYYETQLGADSTLIVDNGSDDETVDFIRKCRNLLYPRGIFSNVERATFISSLANTLLTIYDVVMYTDADEFIVANPEKYSSLRDYIEKNNQPSVTSLGFDLVHMIDSEIDATKAEPILSRHRHLKMNRAMSKTLITRQHILWGGGFHTSDARPSFDADLWLLHAKNASFAQRLRRQRLTRTIVRDDQSGVHQRSDDETLERNFRSFLRLPKIDFDDAYRRELISKLSPTVERVYYDGSDVIRYRFGEPLPDKAVILRLPDSIPELF